MMKKQTVLFLCTGNSARSQMAEAFLRRHGGDKFEVFSAGIEPEPINPFTYQAMKEKGFNLAEHTSKLVNELAGKYEFDYLITVCDEADKNCPVGLVKAAHRLHWSFADPAKFEGSPKAKLDKFRQVRDQISAKISSWLLDLPD